jgi:hypothetical protein
VLLVCTLEVDGSPQTIRPESVCDRVMTVPTIILYPRMFTMVSAHVHDHLILTAFTCKQYRTTFR